MPAVCVVSRGTDAVIVLGTRAKSRHVGSPAAASAVSTVSLESVSCLFRGCTTCVTCDNETVVLVTGKDAMCCYS